MTRPNVGHNDSRCPLCGTTDHRRGAECTWVLYAAGYGPRPDTRPEPRRTAANAGPRQG